MNSKDMTIRHTESGFSVVYQSAVVRNIDVNCNTGTLVLYFADNRIISIDVSKFVELSKAYHSQFGITFTNDGKHFFVQSWETGLFCFDAETGKLLWHNKQKKAYNIATWENVVLCQYYGKCLSVISLESGLIIRSYPLAVGATFKPLSQKYYLVGPQRGFYQILDSNLSRHAKVSVAQLNPNALDTFIIHQATLTEGCIVVKGVEYTGDLFRAAISKKTTDAFIESSRFEREIPIALQ